MKTLTLIIASFMLALQALPTQADEIILHTWSIHRSNLTGMNDDNYGVGYFTNEYGVGLYKNSLNRNTAYVLAKHEIHTRIHVAAGLASGYDVPVMVGLIIDLKPAKIFITPYAAHLALTIVTK